ncbi:MAG: type II toxin-antitoxin system PemK/MazF family toxin [Clostridia bacterium]|nr:type II toxin-antitoxin system PemK/MazF family toxin [Clostridia bacterium]MBQ8368944.1 type II toxin-antitoxin system PemK/MazF family toxin [Clostridia bacterium]
MVKQGDIIKINFNPQTGHEQAGYRPAIVVSNNAFNKRCSMTLVCPITNTTTPYPLHVPLYGTVTTGVVMCEQIRSLDLSARPHHFVESVPAELLEEIIEIITAEITPEN